MNKYLKKTKKTSVLHVVAIKETSREQDLSLALKKKKKKTEGDNRCLSVCRYFSGS